MEREGWQLQGSGKKARPLEILEEQAGYSETGEKNRGGKKTLERKTGGNLLVRIGEVPLGGRRECESERR